MAHTHDRRCPECPGEHGGPGPCDEARYSAKLLRFIEKHLEVYEAAYLDGHLETARNALERLDREYRTLPPRHLCTCAPWTCVHAWIPTHECQYPGAPQLCGYCSRAKPCAECQRLFDERPKGVDIGVSIGHTALVNAPIPSPDMLDIGRARAAGRLSARQIADWLNGR